MVTSVPARGLWLDGVTEAAQDLRLQLAAAMLTGNAPSGTTGIAARPGVRFGYQSPLSVQPSSGMNIIVQAGIAFVQASSASNAGLYTAVLDANATLTVATSDPTNPRIDNVIIQVNDLGTSSSTVVVALQTGTPAPSPVAPTLPANSLLLGTVAVAANASSIIGANLTDQRQFTVANGGILPIRSVASGVVGTIGNYVHETNTGRLFVTDGLGNARQPKIAATAAVSQNVSVGVPTVVGSSTTVASVTVTADGATEFEVFAQWMSLNPGSGTVAGDYALFFLGYDTFGIYANPMIVKADSNNLNPLDGGSLRGWITPAAGTHTFRLDVASVGHAFTVNFPFIRVAPSLQQ